MAEKAERLPDGVSEGVAMTRKSSRLSVPARERLAGPWADWPPRVTEGRELFVTTPQALLLPMSLYVPGARRELVLTVKVVVAFKRRAPWPPAGIPTPVLATVNGKVLLEEPRLLKVMALP